MNHVLLFFLLNLLCLWSSPCYVITYFFPFILSLSLFLAVSFPTVPLCFFLSPFLSRPLLSLCFSFSFSSSFSLSLSLSLYLSLSLSLSLSPPPLSLSLSCKRLLQALWKKRNTKPCQLTMSHGKCRSLYLSLEILYVSVPFPRTMFHIIPQLHVFPFSITLVWFSRGRHYLQRQLEP